MDTPRIIVGSGWWSTSEPNPWLIGDPVTRSPEFFPLWLYLVQKYIRPSQIIVVDSHSPRKPSSDLRANSKVTWLELSKNYGHANDLRTGIASGKYCGVTRAVVLSATVALCNDADLFCYLEQGCLVHGEDFIRSALAGRHPTIMLGSPTEGGRGLHGGAAAPMHQMSLILVGRESLERFITSLMAAPESDGELSPELKLARYCAPFQLLAVPFGRSRPIDFSAPAFYVKHSTADELRQFFQVENIQPSQFGVSLESRS